MLWTAPCVPKRPGSRCLTIHAPVEGRKGVEAAFKARNPGQPWQTEGRRPSRNVAWASVAVSFSCPQPPGQGEQSLGSDAPLAERPRRETYLATHQSRRRPQYMKPVLCGAPQGSGLVSPTPRPLGWAGISRAFGAETKEQTHNRREMAAAAAAGNPLYSLPAPRMRRVRMAHWPTGPGVPWFCGWPPRAVLPRRMVAGTPGKPLRGRRSNSWRCP